jgi:hypothetical protein
VLGTASTSHERPSPRITTANAPTP